MLILKIIGIIIAAILALYLVINVIALVVGAGVFVSARRQEKRIRKLLR